MELYSLDTGRRYRLCRGYETSTAKEQYERSNEKGEINLKCELKRLDEGNP